jgi:putative CocE/NonD family hydrolase
LKKISRPGEYSGYSEKIYSEVSRTSRYLYIRGNNLAIDIYRPARNGAAVTEPYPGILQNIRYQRRGLYTDIAMIKDWVEHGYVVAVLDPRGAGASFGHREGEWSWEEALDARDVIEWLAAQPYCSGKVGMWGFSYMSGIQLLVAATRPPHLAAIVPEAATIDHFFHCPNGVVWTPPRSPKSVEYPLDMAGASADPPQNVDEDTSGDALKAAVKEHEANIYSDQVWVPGRVFRNEYKPEIRSMNFIAQSPITYSDDIKGSGVAVYNIGGWYDAAPAQALAAWKLWGGKVIIGPWGHIGVLAADIAKTEHLRWFDFHLKGIKNSVMEEPPIHHYTINAPAGHEWRATAQWPLPSQRLTRYYFSSGPSGTSASINDGCLGSAPPDGSNSGDSYIVDYSIKVFEEGGADLYRENERVWSGDMEKSADAKGLTFTSPPLEADLQITGVPVICLWVSSSSNDGYFFAFLEEVDGPSKVSRYITDAAIRAACRSLSTRFPFTELGMPYHRCYDTDVQPLVPGVPVELIFDFYPTSYIFRRGNRIRVTLTGSLQSNYAGMIENPPPRITVYRDASRASYIELPVIPSA